MHIGSMPKGSAGAASLDSGLNLQVLMEVPAARAPTIGTCPSLPFQRCFVAATASNSVDELEKFVWR